MGGKHPIPKSQQINEMSNAELNKHLNELDSELLGMRTIRARERATVGQEAGSSSYNSGRLRQLRIYKARLLTILNKRRG